MHSLSQRQLSARPAASRACASTAGRVTVFAPTMLAPSRRLKVAVVAAASKGFGAAPAKPKPQKPKQADPGPPPDPCPCMSGKAFKTCCQSFHSGARTPLTPEAALRARFSAFIKGEEQFIIDSTHPDFLAFHYEGKDAAEAKQQYSQDIKTACTSYDYDTLKVVKSEAGADPETEGFVAFTYRSASKLTADQPEEQRDWKTTNEKARFLRVDKKWLFTDYQRFEYSMNTLMQQPPEPVKQ